MCSRLRVVHAIFHKKNDLELVYSLVLLIYI